MIEYPQVFDPRLPMCHPSGVDSDGFEEKPTMARITPIDSIRGNSGKYPVSTLSFLIIYNSSNSRNLCITTTETTRDDRFTGHPLVVCIKDWGSLLFLDDACPVGDEEFLEVAYLCA